MKCDKCTRHLFLKPPPVSTLPSCPGPGGPCLVQGWEVSGEGREFSGEGRELYPPVTNKSSFFCCRRVGEGLAEDVLSPERQMCLQGPRGHVRGAGFTFRPRP